MLGLGTTELILLLILALIILGAGRLPDIGGALGRGIRSFRKSVQEHDVIDVTEREEKKKEDG